jgi:hypothetical protein
VPIEDVVSTMMKEFTDIGKDAYSACRKPAPTPILRAPSIRARW